MEHSHSYEDLMGTAPARCSMKMLFTWDTTNLCIVFRRWHIRSTTDLIVSLILIVLITAGYEALRECCRLYEAWTTKKLDAVPTDTERTPFLWPGRNRVEVSKRAHIVKAVLYAVQNFYAFMLMLLFMTYNGFVMLAMTVGWFLGYFIFGGATSLTKEAVCH